jgi:hypothetical protein
MRFKHLVFIVLMLLLSPLLTADHRTRASGIVGTGNAESCNEAALDAALAGGGTINFFCGTAPVVITISNEKVIAANALLDGGGLVTISGRNLNRIFRVPAGVLLELRKVALAYGAANDPIDGSNRNGSGGGILIEGGTVVLTDSSVTRNRADHNGAGIYNRAGTLKLVRTTISGNMAGDNGGGILNEQGSLEIANSTFSGNYAGDNGGAIFNFDGKVVLTHATVYDNNAAVSGSGLLNFQNGSIVLRNTIVANIPAAGSPVTGNCSGTIEDGGKNLQFPDNSCGAGIPVADPLLGTLADNGGFAQTHALLDGSPAIDTANDAFCREDPVSLIDERTVTRPIGAACDVGAYEYDPKKAGNPGVSQVCPTPGVPSRTQIPCPRGTALNRQTGKCDRIIVASVTPQTCPQGTTFNPQTGKCETGSQCPAGQTFYPANGGCRPTCPQGQLPDNAGQCVVPACPDGQVRNNQGVCEPPPPPQCPGGTLFNPQTNQCEQITCGQFEQVNPNTNTCECIPGTFRNTQTGVCEVPA